MAWLYQCRVNLYNTFNADNPHHQGILRDAWLPDNYQ
jgi:hypothetical protein